MNGYSLFSKILYVFSSALSMASLNLLLWGWADTARRWASPEYNQRMMPVFRWGQRGTFVLFLILILNAAYEWSHR